MLYCVLIESPEVLNIIQENHIKSIISLLDKHGRNHKVWNIELCLTDTSELITVFVIFCLPFLSGPGCSLLSVCVQRCGCEVKSESYHRESSSRS